MSDATKIEWCDATWNPVTGCTAAGVGCAHCYAARVAERFPAVHGGVTDDGLPLPFSTVICHPERLGIPFRWKKPRAIMCPSMGDLFHPAVLWDFRWEVFKVMERCPQHTFIVLTKRPEQMREYMQRMALELRNVVLGVSCSTQAEADHAIPILLDTPANRRIVSLEPLVGPVDLRSGVYRQYGCAGKSYVDGVLTHVHDDRCRKPLDGVIVGGESGPGARPMHPDWVRSLRDQCAGACTPFMFKQWGEWAPNCLCDTKQAHRTTPRPEPGKPGCMFHCGRHRAGRLLDERTHDELCWDTAGRARAGSWVFGAPLRLEEVK